MFLYFVIVPFSREITLGSYLESHGIYPIAMYFYKHIHIIIMDIKYQDSEHQFMDYTKILQNVHARDSVVSSFENDVCSFQYRLCSLQSLLTFSLLELTRIESTTESAV